MEKSSFLKNGKFSLKPKNQSHEIQKKKKKTNKKKKQEEKAKQLIKFTFRKLISQYI